MMRKIMMLCVPALSLGWNAAAKPMAVRAKVDGNALKLDNGLVQASWTLKQDGLTMDAFKDGARGIALSPAMPAFSLTLGDGSVLTPGTLKPAGVPKVVGLAADPKAGICSERVSGKAIEVPYVCPGKELALTWRAILREGSAYIRQEIVLLPGTGTLAVRKLTLIDMELPGAKVNGEVRGSPVTTDQVFLAIEFPTAVSTVDVSRVECSYTRGVALPARQPHAVSSVMGAAGKGQLRRAFLHYLERERAYAYRPFPHYNSWYHLNIARPEVRMTDAEALKAIRDIGTELTVKRGVTLSSYVMDDGWDSHEKVWAFHDQFPQGFANIAKRAGQYHSGIGLWMSPFGGYGPEKSARLVNGQKAGFEVNANGFSMAGTKYQTHFLNTALHMIRDYRVNFFKFDGMGGGNFTSGGDSAYVNDMDAIFNVVLSAIRKVQPDTYISATVGTWPSPFWLRFADSVWRQGNDTGFAGQGNGRERWITYRDAMVLDRVVRRGPLYPLNALMNGGFIVGERGDPAKMERDEGSVRNEIRSFFGSGTSLQELYIAPHLLTPAMWDSLAESITWAKRNADSLADVHWIGGDPQRLHVYGYASWRPGKGTVCLRNPSDQERAFTLDIGSALELPSGEPKAWRLRSPYKDQSVQELASEAGSPREIRLHPFEVLVFDCAPARRPLF